MSNPDVKENSASPELICIRYQTDAARAHNQTMQMAKIVEFINSLSLLYATDNISIMRARQILTDIDRALWTGQMTLEEVVMGREEWLDLCKKYEFRSVYVHHAVPEAFKVSRKFHDHYALENYKDHTIMVQGENQIDKSYMPRITMTGFLMGPKKVPYTLSHLDASAYDLGMREAKHFLELLPILAELTLDTRNKINVDGRLVDVN